MNQDTHYKLQDIIKLDTLELLREYGVSWNSPYDIILEFERRLATFTGSPYVVTTDCCTHALELCIRWYRQRHPSRVPSITIPDQTYLSVPMMLQKVGASFTISDKEWIGEYQLGQLPIYDSARRLQHNMYEGDTFKCLSFGHGKPLTIGKGGAILLDNREAYDWMIRARYDGRDLNVSPWDKEQYETVGYHYYMSPEQAAVGIVKLDEYKDTAPIKAKYPSITKCFKMGNNT